MPTAFAVSQQFSDFASTQAFPQEQLYDKSFE
jgi:hypothetical protein